MGLGTKKIEWMESVKISTSVSQVFSSLEQKDDLMSMFNVHGENLSPYTTTCPKFSLDQLGLLYYMIGIYKYGRGEGGVATSVEWILEVLH